jgi:magnesium-transporting ATPase (P-type)
LNQPKQGPEHMPLPLDTPHDLDVLRESEETVPKRGVGGWLLIYCILFTLIYPFIAASSLIDNYQKASSNFQWVEGLLTFLLINTGLRVYIVIFSMHAGIALWTERPYALRTTYRFFFVYLLFIVVSVILLYVVPQWDPSDYEILIPITLREVGGGLFYLALIFLYVRFSRRVRATYPD